jgi:membrane associated rhomboid family serine protease
MHDETPPPGPGAPGRPLDAMAIDGPLTRAQAIALLDHGAEMLAAGEYPDAARAYQRVIGHHDADVTAAAFLGLGEALYRLDREADAVSTWEQVLRLPETPSTYPAWRNVAAARVRAGDLRGAMAAYREAERRAPAEDKAEIAARLGWLTKELGDAGASRRYFARARGESRIPPLTMIVIGVTVAVSLACFTTAGQENLLGLLWLDKAAVADGEYWRLFTVTLVHANLLHLAFNMYALWLAGPLVERFYGSLQFLVIYLLTAAAGSIASFVFGGDIPSVGASGAVFGLFGVLLAATRTHDPMVDRSSRMLLAQLGPLVLLNLLFGFLSGGQIDNAAHIGGLVAGLWLGWLLVPSGVPTLAGSFQRPSGMASAGWRASPALRVAGVLALVVILLVGLVAGTEARGGTGPGGILATARDAPIDIDVTNAAAWMAMGQSSPNIT